VHAVLSCKHCCCLYCPASSAAALIVLQADAAVCSQHSQLLNNCCICVSQRLKL
jgi:hypothetical protein